MPYRFPYHGVVEPEDLALLRQVFESTVGNSVSSDEAEQHAMALLRLFEAGAGEAEMMAKMKRRNHELLDGHEPLQSNA
jgi:hypothetical protein